MVKKKVLIKQRAELIQALKGIVEYRSILLNPLPAEVKDYMEGTAIKALKKIGLYKPILEIKDYVEE